MDKSIVVEVERKVKHPKYGKFVKKVPASWHTMKQMNAAKAIRSGLQKPVRSVKINVGDLSK
jgi:ribosomal protein S17